MNVIVGNYGKNTLALIQWAFEHSIQPVTVIDIDTGWMGEGWSTHVEKARSYVRQLEFSAITLSPRQTFPEQIIDRGHFPSQKFQWCAGFLKGLPILEWLDHEDPAGVATIMIGSRRRDSRARAELPEYINESEYFGDRKVWYPLFQHSDLERDELLSKTGFLDLPSRTRECQPCLHGGKECLSPNEKDRLQALEMKIGRTFECADKPTSLEQFDMGCGAPYACGE